MKQDNLLVFESVLLTSEQGHKFSLQEQIQINSSFVGSNNIIEIHPDSLKQTLQGIGVSFTESSAFVLAHLKPSQRSEVMKDIFSEN